MNIKMGLFGQTAAQNIDLARKSIPRGGMLPHPLSTKLRAGQFMLRGGGALARGLDRGAGALTNALFSSGGAAAGAGAEGVSRLYQALQNSPRLSKGLAVGLPLTLAMQVQKADALTPIVNDAIQEGRQVFANDQTFLEKKAAEGKQTEKTAAGIGEFLAGMANPSFPYGGMPGSGNQHPIAGALGAMMGGHPGGLGPPSSAGLAGAMTGGVMRGIGDVIGAGSKGLLDPMAGTAGYRMNRAVNPLMTRVKADELFAQNFIGNLGSEAAKSIVGLLKDVAAKAVSSATQNPLHRSMVSTLMVDDPYLSRADPDQLSAAYHTMSKFAPTLATDENAVRSFLRQAAEAGMGPDFVSIKQLAEAEKAVTE